MSEDGLVLLIKNTIQNVWTIVILKYAISGSETTRQQLVSFSSWTLYESWLSWTFPFHVHELLGNSSWTCHYSLYYYTEQIIWLNDVTPQWIKCIVSDLWEIQLGMDIAGLWKMDTTTLINDVIKYLNLKLNMW